jgi:phosphohistidine phosphatase
MKALFLVRHAKSSWQYPDLDDFERPLGLRGRKNAPLIGAFLKKSKVAPDLIVSSPANRAAMTARIIAAKIAYPLERIHYSEAIYDAGADGLMHLVKQLAKSIQQAMIVGHNPALTDLANHIGDRSISNIPTCGVYCVDLEVSSWANLGEHCGKVRFFEFPKKLTSD